MVSNQRDLFSSRLHEQPDQAHLEYYRTSNFKDRLELVWEPLLALNRSQAIALHEADILEPSEATNILKSLDKLEERTNLDDFDEYEDFEGPYLYLENFLIEDLDEEVGGKLHTGRSRNDLYAAAYRVAIRERILEVIDALLELHDNVLRHAKNTTDVVFPAFTHSQPAQPITFSHYLLAFGNLLGRDFDRLKQSYEITNRSPLGSAAIGGTGFPLDRKRLADLSGFSCIIYNTYDGIASMDYVPQAASSLATLLTSISRVSQDFLVWSMFEINFIELSEKMSNVSSIMPQKKNPGVIEKTRAKASDVIGGANTSLVMLKGVPFGDVGETTYGAISFLKSVDSAVEVIRLFSAIIEDVTLNEDRMYRDAVESFCTMTELADTLVRDGGLSFRQAHEVVGHLTHAVYNDDRHAGEITMKDLNEASERMIDRVDLITNEQLEDALDPAKNVARRNITGGTAPQQNQEDLQRQEAELEDQRSWFDSAVTRLEDAREERQTTQPEA